MARFNSYIIGPLILINLAGIITIVTVEQKNISRYNPPRMLSYNEHHNNLRGNKKLKIQINANNDFEMTKSINENNNSPKELRKLSTTSSFLENNYIFIINLIPLSLCLILIFSFCAEEDGTCECCDSINEDTYYESNSYEHGYVYTIENIIDHVLFYLLVWGAQGEEAVIIKVMKKKKMKQQAA
jgi:hypothetical protein